MTRLLQIAFVLAIQVFAAGSAHAQLVGADTAPGSSCVGFPEGATRMTADADLDGANVVLVCDGTNWQEAPGGDIPVVTGADAPLPGAINCTQRTTVLSNATVTRACNAGETMTGGGCSATVNNLRSSNPSAAATWRCVWTGANANNTAYAICCTL